MRVIADILTDKFLFWMRLNVEGNQYEKEKIIEIDAPDNLIHIWLKDKKNTLITISEKDMNTLGYYKGEQNG